MKTTITWVFVVLGALVSQGCSQGGANLGPTNNLESRIITLETQNERIIKLLEQSTGRLDTEIRKSEAITQCFSSCKSTHPFRYFSKDAPCRNGDAMDCDNQTYTNELYEACARECDKLPSAAFGC
jgi:hypothetical protein